MLLIPHCLVVRSVFLVRFVLSSADLCQGYLSHRYVMCYGVSDVVRLAMWCCGMCAVVVDDVAL